MRALRGGSDALAIRASVGEQCKAILATTVPYLRTQIASTASPDEGTPTKYVRARDLGPAQAASRVLRASLMPHDRPDVETRIARTPVTLKLVESATNVYGWP